MRTLRVASAQFEHAPGDKAANLAKVEHFVAQAAAQGVQLITFPECCLTGYWFLKDLTREQLEALAEPVPEGPSVQRLVSLAHEYDMTIGAGLVEAGADGHLYNAYPVAMPDGRVVTHRKIHAFVSEHISCGDQYTVFNTPHGWRVGVLTCYDCNLGENVRITALQGAEILMAPHQTGGCDSPDPHTMGLVDKDKWARRAEDPKAIEAELCGPKGRGWLMRWLPARAHDNGMFLIFSNGVGVDGDEIRTGNAMILDTYGRVLTETCRAGDDMVITDLDGELLVHNTGKRWIKTRRPDLYGPLTVPTGRERDTRSVRFDKQGV
jgi:predicted amidohydrolase